VGDVLGAANFDDGPAARVHALHDVGIEHGEERVEVTIARGGEEGFNDLFLFFLVCGRLGVVVVAGGGLRSADAAAGAAGELARRLGRAVDDGADLLEGNREHVVEDVGEPLCGGERLEYDEQREAYPVG
jgi:hypothetical protein